MNVFTLIIDTRERHVIRHTIELSQTKYAVKQITTGDFALLLNDKIVVIFERKTLEDYAASIKDGRHDNKKKLIDLRAQTDCKIMYIIEGPKSPNANAQFGRIPWHAIESSIFHLTVRDNIGIIYTEDSLDTAKTLVRFIKSMTTLYCADDTFSGIGASVTPTLVESLTIQQTDEIQNIVADNTNDSIGLLTARQTKSDVEIVRSMWACFKGITVESAADYMNKWSIAEIIRGQVSADEIRAHKHTNGRKINAKTADGLCVVCADVQRKLLESINGISKQSAITLLSAAPLSRLLSYGLEIEMEIIGRTGEKSRRVGEALAKRIVHLFNYKIETQNIIAI